MSSISSWLLSLLGGLLQQHFDENTILESAAPNKSVQLLVCVSKCPLGSLAPEVMYGELNCLLVNGRSDSTVSAHVDVVVPATCG